MEVDNVVAAKDGVLSLQHALQRALHKDMWYDNAMTMYIKVTRCTLGFASRKNLAEYGCSLRNVACEGHKSDIMLNDKIFMPE